MTGVHIIALVAALVTLTVIIELSRRSQLRTKYTVVWLLVGLVIAVFAIAPGLFSSIAHGVGVKSPPNLLVVVAALFLLMVCVYLSWEAGRLEDKTRILARRWPFSGKSWRSGPRAIRRRRRALPARGPGPRRADAARREGRATLGWDAIPAAPLGPIVNSP